MMAGNPYDLPAVLVITDLARVMRTSARSIRRQLHAGTFPITPMTTPIHQIGFDRKYRWTRADVEAFLDGGFRRLSPRQVRLARSA